MSDTYTPRFDGIHSDVALPGRCPMTGQLVSGHEVDEPDYEQPEKALGLSAETPEERDYWCDYLGLQYGSSLSEETEAWAEWKFGRKFFHLWENDLTNTVEALGEAYEHLPPFEARKHVLSNWEIDSDRDYRYYVNNHGNRTQKGRPSRFNKRNRVCANHIRDARLNTHRQMDYIWLTEMTEATQSSFESMMHSMRRASEADAEGHLDDINEKLWDSYKYELLLTEQHWEQHHAGPMTEELQSCHGFSGRDPVEEKLELINREWIHQEMLLDEHGFWGEYDSYHDEVDWDKHDDPIDRCEFGILTEEEETYLDAEAAALEAEAEALEAAFEHLAVGNATGRRMQLAARVD